MNYEKIYNDLMNDRLNKKPLRLKEKRSGFYFEGHHILPKCKGGTGTSTRAKNNPNIVLLTAREHFLAHWLLWRIYGDRQMALAFHKMMSSTKHTNRITSSRGYAEAREAFRITNIGNTYGKGVVKVVSEEQRLNHSKLMKGRYSGERNPFFGKTHTQESIRKISEKAKTRPIETMGGYKGLKVLIKEGIILGEFKSSKEVAEIIGCSHSNVRHVLSGAQKTANGYVVKYKNLVY